ncbi:MAG: glycine--tRNA ligase subunit beta [Gammaproteobacteria bacterium]|nr:glycine--tRNA ligase subunit beta [Gammaproteobacteria bacterium]
MSTEHVLVEIGTEELPPKALKNLRDALAEGINAGLDSAGLSYGQVHRYASPRRLAVHIEDLQLQAPDQNVESLGPPADRAREADGSWSKAALGFAKKNGISPDQLQTVVTEKGLRLAYKSQVSGANAAVCLPGIIERSVRELPAPRRMRWGSGRTEFVRPVHWIVVLLGEQVLECEILGKRAGNRTRGHRFHSSGELTLKRPADYCELLRAHKVIASFEERRERIREQVVAAALALGARAEIDPALLDEVTGLVEWPVALTGNFEQRFLQIPAEALISSMKEHQKYFHMVDAEGHLQAHFIAVSNLESNDPAQVVEGNERVIRPRLSDADFFFRSDQKTPLVDRVERLRDVVFQQKLGSLYDKTLRLQQLARALAGDVGADPDQAVRAATLCKADLISDLVGEFADMQGIAGRYYALNDGEAEAVADALQQHYWPRFAGDKLPQTPVATTVALADRLDTLVGIFGIGQAPTGSRDPFALRRASLGVLRIVVGGELELDLRQYLQTAAAQYPAGVLADGAVEATFSYMLERFRAWYEDEQIPAQVFQAVSAKQLNQPLDIHRRVHAVHAFAQLPEASSLAAANKRVSNLLEKQGAESAATEVSKDLLQEPAEVTLAQLITEKAAILAELLREKHYTEGLAILADLQSPVDDFFDQVMVMVEEPDLRANRLGLLKSLRDLFLQVADISLLVVAK